MSGKYHLWQLRGAFTAGKNSATANSLNSPKVNSIQGYDKPVQDIENSLFQMGEQYGRLAFQRKNTHDDQDRMYIAMIWNFRGHGVVYQMLEILKKRFVDLYGESLGKILADSLESRIDDFSSDWERLHWEA